MTIPSSTSIILQLDRVTCRWDGDNVVDNVSFSMRRGDLLTVIGPVGSGKSSLLMAILGETLLTKGSVTAHGDIAYASQEAWILSDTVRSNILFGRPYDGPFYKKVVTACQLLPDFHVFDNDDLTWVGERGIALSGTISSLCAHNTLSRPLCSFNPT